MKIRIKFRKYGALKFIGHLDMMRYFQKALRRAEIDVKYSEGFHPHIIMSFAAPLGVGITSDGEYFDIEVLSTKSTEESLKNLNAVMVEGVEVTSYVALPDQTQKAMSIVAAADYEVYFKDGYQTPKSSEEFAEIFHHFFVEQEAILVTKETKRGEKEIDLKPLIYEFAMRKKNGQPSFYLKVSAGSVDNVKPEIVLQKLFQFAGLEYSPSAMQIHKIETYAKNEREYIPLDALGEIIV
ncbi:MAG: DUF2344 domain-containing protein [Lachnospiraceae bacterium]|nr:DUF2344 domain-containing protein [Lachnospiraceae bacterium]